MPLCDLIGQGMDLGEDGQIRQIDFAARSLGSNMIQKTFGPYAVPAVKQKANPRSGESFSNAATHPISRPAEERMSQSYMFFHDTR